MGLVSSNWILDILPLKMHGSIMLKCFMCAWVGNKAQSSVVLSAPWWWVWLAPSSSIWNGWRVYFVAKVGGYWCRSNLNIAKPLLDWQERRLLSWIGLALTTYHLNVHVDFWLTVLFYEVGSYIKIPYK